MAQVVELDLNELAGDISPALLDDMQEAETEMQAQALAKQQVAMMAADKGGFKRSDFRQHAQGVFDGVEFDGQPAYCIDSQSEAGEPAHWLLSTVYGRDVLKAYLAAQHPEIKVSKWRTQPELDPLLEDIIDSLELRHLAEPKSLQERIGYLAKMSRVLMTLDDEDQKMVAV